MSAGTCNRCGAGVQWVRDPFGNNVPLADTPNERGAWVLMLDGERAVRLEPGVRVDAEATARRYHDHRQLCDGFGGMGRQDPAGTEWARRQARIRAARLAAEAGR